MKSTQTVGVPPACWRHKQESALDPMPSSAPHANKWKNEERVLRGGQVHNSQRQSYTRCP